MDNENIPQEFPVQENVSSGMNTFGVSAKALMKLPVPLFAVAAYLAMGFLWDWWHPGWLLFLGIPVYYGLVSMQGAADLRRKLLRFPIAPLCVLVYLMLGFFLHFWHPSWMIFLLIPAYYVIVGAVFPKA